VLFFRLHNSSRDPCGKDAIPEPFAAGAINQQRDGLPSESGMLAFVPDNPVLRDDPRVKGEFGPYLLCTLGRWSLQWFFGKINHTLVLLVVITVTHFVLHASCYERYITALTCNPRVLATFFNFRNFEIESLLER
jgi:hypothetical protein